MKAYEDMLQHSLPFLEPRFNFSASLGAMELSLCLPGLRHRHSAHFMLRQMRPEILKRSHQRPDVHVCRTRTVTVPVSESNVSASLSHCAVA